MEIEHSYDEISNFKYLRSHYYNIGINDFIFKNDTEKALNYFYDYIEKLGADTKDYSIALAELEAIKLSDIKNLDLNYSEDEKKIFNLIFYSVKTIYTSACKELIEETK